MFEFQLQKEFKKRKTKLVFKEDIEFHEILLDSFAQKNESEGDIADRRIEVPLLQNILRGFFVICAITLLVLFAKTFQLQVIEGGHYSALAKENKYVFRQTQAERGVIYDSNMKQLVSNLPSFDLIVNVSSLPEDQAEKERVLKDISIIIGKDFDSIKKEINESKEGTVLLAENLQHDKLVLLEAKISQLHGVEIVNNPIREYADGNVFSHLLGYIGRIAKDEWKEKAETYLYQDYIGRSGVEKTYEDVLRKNSGQIQIERDVYGNIISKKVIELPESGNSLVLWLDADLQKKLYEEMEKILSAVGTKRGVAIALNPKTGGVLALVSMPGYDNNLFQKGADPLMLKNLLGDQSNLQPLFNRAISGKYPTGSTIKPLLSAAALQENLISPEKQIYSPGFLQIPNPYNSTEPYIFRDNAVHGWVDMRKAIAQSTNVYFYTIGGGYGDQQGLGPSRIKKYLELFGWGSKTNIDLSGETDGSIPSPEWKEDAKKEKWYDGDTYNLSIGQGFLQISPIQVAAAYAAIANDGKLMQPQIVKQVINPSLGDDSISMYEAKVVRENFIDDGYLQIVREGMRQAVTGQNSPLASSIILNTLPVSVAAKTGTAELGGNRFHNWIGAFAPYENPEIVLVVMIEDVKGVQAAALPVARNVLDWYFNR